MVCHKDEQLTSLQKYIKDRNIRTPSPWQPKSSTNHLCLGSEVSDDELTELLEKAGGQLDSSGDKGQLRRSTHPHTAGKKERQWPLASETNAAALTSTPIPALHLSLIHI